MTTTPITQTASDLGQLFLIFSAVVLFLYGIDAQAALPTDTTALLPDDLESTDTVIDTGVSLGRFGIQIIAALLAGAVTLGVGYQIYTAFIAANTDRNTGWGKFVATSIAGVFVVAMVVSLAIFAFDYAAA